MSSIVVAMKEFARPSNGEKEMRSLAQIARTSATLIRTRCEAVADFVLDIDDELPLLSGVSDELNQVVLCLLENAAEAVERRIAETPGERGVIAVRVRGDGNVALLEVADNGVGIDAVALEKIFDPDFIAASDDTNVAPLRHGLGRGLATAYAAVTGHHRGTIEATSQPAVGTRMLVRIPFSSPALRAS
jgi:signal transduction histidine kinase